VNELTELLAQLAPWAIGASVTVFDPDLDPDGRYSRVVTDVIADGLARLGVAAAQNPGPAIPG
jgi:arginase